MDQRPWNAESVSSATSLPPSSSTSSSDSQNTASTLPSSSEKKGNSKGPQIGIAVGLGIPFLITLGLLFWENRKRKRAEALLVQPETDFKGPSAQAVNVMSYQQPKAPGYQQVHEASGVQQLEMPSSREVVYDIGTDARRTG